MTRPVLPSNAYTYPPFGPGKKRRLGPGERNAPLNRSLSAPLPVSNLCFAVILHGWDRKGDIHPRGRSAADQAGGATRTLLACSGEAVTGANSSATEKLAKAPSQAKPSQHTQRTPMPLLS